MSRRGPKLQDGSQYKWKDKAWLYDKIIEDHMSPYEIAALAGCTPSNIYYYAKKYGIPLRKPKLIIAQQRKLRPTPEERFWSKVDRINKDRCWFWKIPGKTRYGTFWDGSKTVLAHRYSWILHNGKIPDNLCVLHICGNSRCVNPNHLYLGTKADNARDRDADGYAYRHLTNGELALIGKLYLEQKLERDEICDILNVSYVTVCNVIRDRRWEGIDIENTQRPVEPLSLKVPESIYEKILNIAGNTYSTKSAVVRDLLLRGLASYERESNEQAG